VLSVAYPLRFLFASRPDILGAVLAIVYRVIATHLARTAGFSAKRARTGAVTLIQRFGGALNLNVHFHMLFLDGVYVEGPEGALSLRWVKAPTGAELTALASRIAERVGHFLERRGLLERDAESASLSEFALDEEPMQALLAHSITYRIAVGPRAGRKVFTLQSLPAGDEPFGTAPGQVGGFSLHAGVAARADERKKLERLCRYISRTTHVLFEPLDFIARLAALVPIPRVNLTRYHGVFAPNSAHRAQVTKAQRGRGARGHAAAETDDRTPAQRRASMSWAQRLKRVFGIDIETCPVCGGASIIACVEDPAVVEKILAHLDAKAAAGRASRPPPCRAPPVRALG
jgi:hypothetical protein